MNFILDWIKGGDQQIEGSDSHQISSLGVASTRQTWVCLNGSRGRLQMWSEGWDTSSVRTIIQPGEENSPGRTFSSLSGPKGAYKRNFLPGSGVWERTRGNGFTLKEGWFRLDRKRTPLQWGWWDTLDLFEVRLDGTLSSLDLKIPWPMEVRLLWVISGVPFQPKPFHDSVIPDPDDFSYG